MPAFFRDLVLTGDPRRAAIRAPGRPDLLRSGLDALLARTAARLRESGIERGDRLALVVPNGPEMAVAFLAVAAELGAAAAPLNPAYRQSELELYLGDLQPRALIIEASLVPPGCAAIPAARALGIPIVLLRPSPAAPAGTFELEAIDGTPRSAAAAATGGPDSIALLLHTSGTTSRPKLVPLTTDNLVASATNLVATLGLDADDTTLNVMPLFHIHGLMAALVATLASGGAVFCTPGFNPLRFFRWLEESRATWFTAVPSMHQALLARARDGEAVPAGTALRFVRSCSSTLPLAVWDRIESVFTAPVVNAYGMTEGSHQISCTSRGDLAARGTVGQGGATEIAILDGDGGRLAAGAAGEVAIRGAAVTRGYCANPEANRAAFVGDWLRTGDEGVLDERGRLTLLGRRKEIINAGGEKISPFEIEEALLAHPDVASAVAFAVPSRTLGEAVAAAVVLQDGASVAPDVIRTFVADRLAPFKVPRRVVLLAEIPKGPTGKPQRIGMAATLGLDREP